MSSRINCAKGIPMRGEEEKGGRQWCEMNRKAYIVGRKRVLHSSCYLKAKEVMGG
jgi:hypothetical protein